MSWNLVAEWLLIATSMLAVGYVVGALLFRRVLLRRDEVPPPDFAWPRAAVLMALRGADPQLTDGLRRLLRQDHPNYEVRLIIDNEGDPAYEVARRLAEELRTDRLRVAVIEQRRTTCGLQCSALTQAAQALDESVDVVVTIDGDVLTHPSWLRELAAPLLKPNVGLSFGNRWFLPRRGWWGSIVRYLWNAAAVPPMHFSGIPWGGTMAIRRRALVESGLLEHWPRAMVHDAPAVAMLARLGLQTRFVPSLMMAIREDCTVSFAFDFFKRQLLWTRLYHPHWAPLPVLTLLTTALWIVPTAAIVVGSAAGDAATTRTAATALAVFWLGLFAPLPILERSVQEAWRRRGEALPSEPPGFWWKAFAAIPLTYFVFAAALVAASMSRRVVWRGVSYAIRGPFDVALTVDRRSDVQTMPASSEVSL